MNDKPLQPTDILVPEKHWAVKNPEIKTVEITWVDAVAVGEDWTDEESIHTSGMPSLAIGYLIHENDDAVTLISLVNTHHYGHGITIPKGCIKAMRTVE